MAFILVPAAVDADFADPPEIDPNLPVQYVGMNETREWNLEDILVIPLAATVTSTTRAP